MTKTSITQVEIDKTTAVLLNKVEKLHWYYYSVDLEPEPFSAKSLSNCGVFDLIVQEGSRTYRWTGSDGEDKDKLLGAVIQVLNHEPDAAREVFRRIFDLNQIPNDSDADTGIKGFLNEADRRRRERKYERRLRTYKCRNRPVVVAEGDSWFQFPAIGYGWARIDPVRDILDHLIAGDTYCIKSIAAGGDWLSNMLHTQEYVEPLSRIEPDVFLVSGGGNDLMGGGRIANMVRHRMRAAALTDTHNELLSIRQPDAGEEPKHPIERKYRSGVHFLAEEFFDFLNLVLVQYYLLFLNIAQSKLARTIIVTQGYDYAMPRCRSNAFPISLRSFVNWATKSGNWLYWPLEQKKLTDEQKEAAVYAMITEFNELMIRLATLDLFPNVYHIDNRGIADPEKDWYDEIHLKSRRFSDVAKLYRICIHRVLNGSPLAKKVYTVDDVRTHDPSQAM